MKKKFVLLLLSTCLILNSSYGVSAYSIVESEDIPVEKYAETMTVGTLEIIDLSNEIDADAYLFSIEYIADDDIISDDIVYAYADFQYVNNNLYVRPYNGGRLNVKLIFSNNQEYILDRDVWEVEILDGSDMYNPLWWVQRGKWTNSFSYNKVRLVPELNEDGKIDALNVVCDEIQNVSDKTLVPDMRLAFYDADKNLLGYFQFKDKLNDILAPQETVGIVNIPVDYSELPKENLEKVAFWGIVALDEVSEVNSVSDITLVKKSDTSIKVSWKSTVKDVKYIVQYATNKKFKNKIQKSTTKNKIILKKLKSGKTYYVRVKQSGGKWLPVQKIKL